MPEEPTFEIAHPPERRYSRHAGFEYAGETVFSLSPVADEFDTGAPKRGVGDSTASAVTETGLDGLLTDVLSGEPYTYGDWFDLPMALYLVHDGDTGDVFRVGVRDGAVELHVLPSTDPAGLRGLYRRLCDASGVDWRVERRVSAD